MNQYCFRTKEALDKIKRTRYTEVYRLNGNPKPKHWYKMGGEIMDKDTQERIDMITGMIMAITNMQENDVEDLIKGTIVYRNIVRGEECTLYEDYSANLMDIVKELKKRNVGSSICGITPVEISDLNQWMFSNDIEDARQLKGNNYRSHIIETEVAADILDKDME